MSFILGSFNNNGIHPLSLEKSIKNLKKAQFDDILKLKFVGIKDKSIICSKVYFMSLNIF